MGELSMATVGLALIVKDEERTLPKLLASIEGAFQQVVLVDTGSKDKTVEVFQAWAHAQAGMTFKVAHFEWVNDFSVARAYADSLLETDWYCWADADDELVGADTLRTLADNAPEGVAAYIFGYNYAQHPDTGECMCHLRRERLVRAGRGTWMGRVHEAQSIDGQVQFVDDGVCHWRHGKQAVGHDAARASNSRNLKILKAWDADEPDNPRVVGYLGTEHMVRGQTASAIKYFKRYLKLKTGWDEERAQIHRKLSGCYQMVDDVEAAELSALEALRVLPSWPDSYLTLAECAFARGEWDKAIEWCRQVVARGAPQTLLIINPLDYSFNPRRLMAAALGALERFHEAIEVAEEAMKIHGADRDLQGGWASWKFQAKRENTAQTYIMAAQQLVAHDEQVKALTLLEDCVPHFAQDHAGVVGMRSHVRQRLLWLSSPEAFAEHYATGGSKPEDFHSDEECERICEALPRVHMLIGGLLEQGAELAEAA